MINPDVITRFFIDHDVSLITGVPDSVLSSLSCSFEQSLGSSGHIITANEGNAAALAMGHYMAGGGPAVVYLQNSGLGNLVNPLTSLAHADIYRLPMFLVVGWRGYPGILDEPQHLKQGRSTVEMLGLLDIPHWHLAPDENPLPSLAAAWQEMEKNKTPVAVLVGKGAMGEAINMSTSIIDGREHLLTREAAINTIVDVTNPFDALIATTGKAGRELFEVRRLRQEPIEDFLTVGGMGHASSIALGVARLQPDRRVICLDGDGAILMHMGAMAIIGSQSPKNFVHVILNNESHDSVGGQPTVAGQIDFRSLAFAVGYKSYHHATNQQELRDIWSALDETAGPALVEVAVFRGARRDLGRPTTTPEDNKLRFMKKLASATK